MLEFLTIILAIQLSGLAVYFGIAVQEWIERVISEVGLTGCSNCVGPGRQPTQSAAPYRANHLREYLNS